MAHLKLKAGLKEWGGVLLDVCVVEVVLETAVDLVCGVSLQHTLRIDLHSKFCVII